MMIKKLSKYVPSQWQLIISGALILALVTGFLWYRAELIDQGFKECENRLDKNNAELQDNYNTIRNRPRDNDYVLDRLREHSF